MSQHLLPIKQEDVPTAAGSSLPAVSNAPEDLEVAIQDENLIFIINSKPMVTHEYAQIHQYPLQTRFCSLLNELDGFTRRSSKVQNISLPSRIVILKAIAVFHIYNDYVR
jgi:hypothetical protein